MNRKTANNKVRHSSYKLQQTLGRSPSSPSVRGNRKNAAKISEKAGALMKKVGIAELDKRDITQVSGGQLQRAGICRALMNSPKIIFGDEPTGALNSKSAQEIMDIFSEINTNGTAVMF